MTVARMKKFQIVGHKKGLDQISGRIIDSESIQLIDYSEFVKSGQLPDEIESLQRENPFSDLLKKLEDIFCDLDIDCKLEKIPEIKDVKELNLQDIEDETGEIKAKVERIVDFRERVKEEEERIKNLIHHIKLMKNMDIDLDELKKFDHISLIFGRVENDSYERLIKNVTDWPVVILEVHQEEKNVWFFSFTKKENEEMAFKLLNSVYFEKLELPGRVRGQPAEILQRAYHRLERIEIGYDEIDLYLRKYRHLYGEKLIRYYQKIKFLHRMRELNNRFYGESLHLFVLNGWIPLYKEEEFVKKIENEFEDVIYTSREVEFKEEEKPPIVLQNKRFISPFENLVKLYGLPGYGEIDPSPLLAFSYLLMFGMMFGDVGQGLVFSLVGYLISRRYIKLLNREAGLLLGSLGLSSAFFGLLYGSVFGMEDILPALWMRPMDNITRLLGLTIGVGIVLMLIAMILNIINSFRLGDLESGLFSRNGLSGLIFYIIMLVSVYYLLVKGSLLFNVWVTGVLLLIPLVVIYLKTPLTNLLKNKQQIWPEDTGNYLLEEAFEILDTLISFLSNTVSFVRIGAFALNHIGLFMAVFILARMMRGQAGGLLWSSLIIIGGNIIIMALEGLVVGIQVLRLEYFEIFGKFFRGKGEEFKPVKID